MKEINMRNIVNILFLLLITFFLRCNNKINYSISRTVIFSHVNISDTILVSIYGNSFEDSKFKITIINSQNDTIYHFVDDFLGHIVESTDDKKYFDQCAQNLIKETVYNSFETSTSGLPNYLPNSEYYEEYYENIEITREKYEKLRLQAYPIFRHSTYYEGWRKVCFDPDKGKVITIIDGGL